MVLYTHLALVLGGEEEVDEEQALKGTGTGPVISLCFADGGFGVGPPRGRLGRISPLDLATLVAVDSFCRSCEGKGTRNDDFLDANPLEDAVVMEAVVAVETAEEEEVKPDLLALSISYISSSSDVFATSHAPDSII